MPAVKLAKLQSLVNLIIGNSPGAAEDRRKCQFAQNRKYPYWRQVKLGYLVRLNVFGSGALIVANYGIGEQPPFPAQFSLPSVTDLDALLVNACGE